VTAIHLDSDLSEPERRRQLYEGDLFVFSPLPSTLALAEHAEA
jgi:hypothetical protein